MNKLNFFLLCCLFTTFFACISNNEKKIDEKIIGLWQNVDNPDMGIEFDKNGFYYLLDSNKRLVIENSTAFKYSFNQKFNNENNFILTEKDTGFEINGKLTHIDENNINLTLNVSESLNINGFYSRMNN